jgi:exosortase O
MGKLNRLRNPQRINEKTYCLLSMNSISNLKPPNYLLTISLIGIWTISNIWTFSWFIASLKYSSPFNLIILSIVMLTLGIQLWRNQLFKLESLAPQFKLYPLLLMLGGEIIAMIIKWSIAIPQLSLLCFILANYGLLGLFINSQTWQKNLVLAIITACILPFSITFDSGLGFPVRVITAHIIADFLSMLHLSAISSHDIILMENGIAQVDLPCSGLKSLWTGTVFLLGATWLENRRVGFSWLILACANILFLFIANLLRIFTLVLLVEVFQQKQIAEVLHLPLGVIGFILAIILSWLLLQKIPRQNETLLVTTTSHSTKLNLNWLLTIVFMLGIIGQFKPFISPATALNSLQIPAEIKVTENLALSETENNFFANSGNPLVEKVRFQSANLSGSMLLVASDTWHSHHPPELCFVGNGLKVDRMESQLINNLIHTRWLSLENNQLSATYWFQSSQETTDNFISRMWEDITHSNKTWVLVSVLFDNSPNSTDTEVEHFVTNMYQTINHTFNS